MNTPLVILGPTASGKSDTAMAYATARAGTEIVAIRWPAGIRAGGMAPFQCDWYQLSSLRKRKAAATGRPSADGW